MPDPVCLVRLPCKHRYATIPICTMIACKMLQRHKKANLLILEDGNLEGWNTCEQLRGDGAGPNETLKATAW